MTTGFQKRWSGIAERFGLKVRAPFEIEVGDVHFTAPVLLEDFGPPRGMILVCSYDEIVSVKDVLVKEGFGYSCLGESTDLEIDEEGLVEMLRDWGWSGSDNPPDFLGETNAT